MKKIHIEKGREQTKKMPTTFTHDYFGKKVYQKMPGEMKRLVKAHGELYRIGLHGPDILFYYGIGRNRINQQGVRLHREAAAPFFERGAYLVKKEEDEGLLAYLLGFVCHFMLDSTCHPYINGTVAGQVSHGEIEKELDRRMLLLNGRNPHRYYPAVSCIRPTRQNAVIIQKMFPEVSVWQMVIALKGMIFLTNTMVYDDNGRKKKAIMPVLKLTGQYEHVGGNYMKESCDPRCGPYLDELERLFAQAVEETPEILESFWKRARGEERLSQRFWRDYN